MTQKQKDQSKTALSSYSSAVARRQTQNKSIPANLKTGQEIDDDSILSHESSAKSVSKEEFNRFKADWEQEKEIMFQSMNNYRMQAQQQDEELARKRSVIASERSADRRTECKHDKRPPRTIIYNLCIRQLY